MKLLFLDFDGVLNSEPFYRVKASGVLPLDPAAVALLNELVRRARARVVVSSSWRLGRRVTVASLRRTLEEVGFSGRVVGKTPELVGQPRGLEIQAYLNGWKGKAVESFVILDDDADMVHLSHRLVKTTFRTGLTAQHVDRAVAMFERSECRRCSECQGQAHHWCSEIRTDDGRLQCKHCDATAEDCEPCDGLGGVNFPCGECGGTGVVDVRP
jgi:hypothetical protein